jgi:hypothetical protein
MNGKELALAKLANQPRWCCRLHRPLGVRSIFSTQFPLML